MKIALAHMGAGQFTQQIAKAFDDEDMLGVFFCTLVNQPDAWWQKAAIAGAKMAGVDLAKDFKKRTITEISNDKIQTYPFRESIRMLLNRLAKSSTLDDIVFHWSRNGFDSWVTSRLSGCDGVYGYEYGSLEMFGRAKVLGMHTIYDLPAPEHNFVRKLLQPEFDRFLELRTTYHKRTEKLHKQRTERRRQEWELADLVLANSRFTAKTWKDAGWSEKKIEVIPLGAPPVTNTSGPRNTIGPLRMIWAGTFSVRKGAHYLIEALRQMGSDGDCIQIDVYGTVTLPKALLEQCPKNLHFKGSVARPELLKAMNHAELLVFPTLCDGFGMVVNEALSQGLPVLTTRRAGAADLIEEDRNGWLINAGDAMALQEALRRALDERGRLAAFSEAAKATAAEWQWSDYRRKLVKVVKESFYV